MSEEFLTNVITLFICLSPFVLFIVVVVAIIYVIDRSNRNTRAIKDQVKQAQTTQAAQEVQPVQKVQMTPTNQKNQVPSHSTETIHLEQSQQQNQVQQAQQQNRKRTSIELGEVAVYLGLTFVTFSTLNLVLFNWENFNSIVKTLIITLVMGFVYTLGFFFRNKSRFLNLGKVFLIIGSVLFGFWGLGVWNFNFRSGELSIPFEYYWATFSLIWAINNFLILRLLQFKKLIYILLASIYSFLLSFAFALTDIAELRVIIFAFGNLLVYIISITQQETNENIAENTPVTQVQTQKSRETTSKEQALEVINSLQKTPNTRHEYHEHNKSQNQHKEKEYEQAKQTTNESRLLETKAVSLITRFVNLLLDIVITLIVLTFVDTSLTYYDATVIFLGLLVPSIFHIISYLREGTKITYSFSLIFNVFKIVIFAGIIYSVTGSDNIYTVNLIALTAYAGILSLLKPLYNGIVRISSQIGIIISVGIVYVTSLGYTTDTVGVNKYLEIGTLLASTFFLLFPLKTKLLFSIGLSTALYPFYRIFYLATGLDDPAYYLYIGVLLNTLLILPLILSKPQNSEVMRTGHLNLGVFSKRIQQVNTLFIYIVNMFITILILIPTLDRSDFPDISLFSYFLAGAIQLGLIAIINKKLYLLSIPATILNALTLTTLVNLLFEREVLNTDDISRLAALNIALIIPVIPIFLISSFSQMNKKFGLYVNSNYILLTFYAFLVSMVQDLQFLLTNLFAITALLTYAFKNKQARVIPFIYILSFIEIIVFTNKYTSNPASISLLLLTLCNLLVAASTLLYVVRNKEDKENKAINSNNLQDQRDELQHKQTEEDPKQSSQNQLTSFIHNIHNINFFFASAVLFYTVLLNNNVITGTREISYERLIALIFIGFTYLFSQNKNLRRYAGIPVIAGIWEVALSLEASSLAYVTPVCLYIFILIQFNIRGSNKVQQKQALESIVYILLLGNLLLESIFSSGLESIVYFGSIVVLGSFIIIYIYTNPASNKQFILIPLLFIFISIVVQIYDIVLEVPWWIYLGIFGILLILFGIKVIDKSTRK